jgi:hypothetical protein
MKTIAIFDDAVPAGAERHATWMSDTDDLLVALYVDRLADLLLRVELDGNFVFEASDGGHMPRVPLRRGSCLRIIVRNVGAHPADPPGRVALRSVPRGLAA